MVLWIFFVVFLKKAVFYSSFCCNSLLLNRKHVDRLWGGNYSVIWISLRILVGLLISLLSHNVSLHPWGVWFSPSFATMFLTYFLKSSPLGYIFFSSYMKQEGWRMLSRDEFPSLICNIISGFPLMDYFVLSTRFFREKIL